MKALTFQAVETLDYGSVPDPRIEAPADAVVKVEVAAVCGSDLHPYHGRETGLDPGTVMGHEFVGEVVEVGTEAGVVPGTRVASPFTSNCGVCFYCRRGLTARCELGQLFGWVEGGAGLHGAQAEYVRVPLAATTLLPVPDGVSSELALLAGDVLSTGLFCAEMGNAGPGVTVVVLGCGPVGLMAVAAARELGAERIFAVDSIPARLALAERLGAEPLDLSELNVAEVVREATDGRGADSVLEAVGTPQASRLAIELVRPGGTVAAAGVHTEHGFAFSPGEAYDKNLTYRAGRCPARSYMDRALSILQTGTYPLGELVTHRLPLSEGVRAYRLFDRKEDGCIKVLLRP